MSRRSIWILVGALLVVLAGGGVAVGHFVGTTIEEGERMCERLEKVLAELPPPDGSTLVNDSSGYCTATDVAQGAAYRMPYGLEDIRAHYEPLLAQHGWHP